MSKNDVENSCRNLMSKNLVMSCRKLLSKNCVVFCRIVVSKNAVENSACEKIIKQKICRNLLTILLDISDESCYNINVKLCRNLVKSFCFNF